MVDGVIRFQLGRIFISNKHMRETFKEYAIQEGIKLKRVKNDKVRQTYKCGADVCGWRAHASWMIDGMNFMLKILSDQHDCHRVYNNKEATVKWITSKFEKLVKSNPSIDVKVICDLLRESYKVSIDIRRLYRAKNRALKKLAKDHAKCFGYLRRCHLKGPFGGVLHSVMSLVANSRLFPLAVCICEKETQDSWEWFLNNLKNYLNYPEGKNLIFMYDRQKGYYARSIYVNFKLTYKSDHYKKLFWRAARSSNIYYFQTCMEEIGIIKPDAKKWLMDIDP
ncbi:hypothetical protein Ddye_015922 [Dipteronia dyeriana]|uniref:Transposase MuDR plant domain-containing protein n=1 Tax=Dipteronia dyeriana TaxID=168575 RepID=A0AAD9U6H1_9ROSI|nr:hypothetical protein Ddye_015922 [Dipteronia dyeriana]